MSLPLEHWQDRLDRHFRSLANLRAAAGLPIFALEHGLTKQEVEEVSSLLRAHILSGKGLSTFWLLWVVYATEIGYRYTGDEYWQSFEEQTPGWESHHRQSLREWFRQFQTTYCGVKPSGPWAEHFLNIAWPITHAIVPKYLQHQFAHAIYQLRFRLAGISTLDSISVGRLLATHTYDATTRFEKFLQQEELTGRIVLGLLGEAPPDGQEPIYPAALQRIVADLEDVRKTRTWLKEARRTVVDRFKGIGHGAGPSTGRPEASERDRAPDQFAHPDIRPNVLLRYSGGEKWNIAIEIPSFAAVAALSTELRAFLKQTRCRLAGTIDTKPAGWILSGNRSGILKSWPDPGRQVIEFEQTHTVLDGLLGSDCLLSGGPIWLFRVGSDGIAREIRSHLVRSGGDYIVLAEQDLAAASPLISPCVVDCEGIHASRFSVPANLSAEDTAQINAIGLQVARTIRVWPSGMPCRGWDGEGQSEWLTTEKPYFGIVHDHPVAAYHICLNGGPETIVNAPSVGGPVFIQLAPLPAGKHRLTVLAKRHDSLAEIAHGASPEGFIDLRVREPEPWVPGVPAHTGLIVTVEPHDANLDDLWVNKVSLSVAGPESHSVICTVSLEKGSGEQVLSEQVGRSMPLPVRPESWRKHFTRFVERKENVWRYLEASAGEVTIEGDELGKYVIRFERDIVPVRWLTRQHHGNILLRLIDDTGLEASEADCQFFSMERPVTAQTPELSDLLAGLCPSPPGGLYMARHGDHGEVIVVSSVLAGEGLQGLGVASDFSDILTGSVSIPTALQVLASWTLARLAGFLPDIRRDKITLELLAAIYAKLCGKNWSEAESAFRSNPKSTRAVETLQQRVGASFGAALKMNHTRVFDEFSQSSQWYADLSHRYSVCSNPMLCEFAIRLACKPHRLPSVYGSDLDQLIKQAASNPKVLRGARYAALLCSVESAIKKDGCFT